MGETAYKGFHKDMTCLGKQYEEGEEYREGFEAKVGHCGMHACRYPLDCFNQHSPAGSVYHEVVQDGHIDKSEDDTTQASSWMEIGKRLDTEELIKASVEYLKGQTSIKYDRDLAIVPDGGIAKSNYGGTVMAGNHAAALTTNKGTAYTGDFSVAATGNYGKVITGNCSAASVKKTSNVITGQMSAVNAKYNANIICGGRCLVTAEENTYAISDNASTVIIGNRGKGLSGYGSTVNTGRCGMSMVGNNGTAVSGRHGMSMTGEDGIAKTEDYGMALASTWGKAITGTHGMSVSRGRAQTGECGLSVARGTSPMVKGGLGAVLVLIGENPETYEIKQMRTVLVDGETIKADTWYSFDKNGNLEEIGDDARRCENYASAVRTMERRQTNEYMCRIHRNKKHARDCCSDFHREGEEP